MDMSGRVGLNVPPKNNIYIKVPALLKVSKLTISDLAYLVGVSRPTVYSWVDQDTVPRGIKKQRLDKILRDLHSAYKAGILPFPVKPNAKIRKQALIEVLKQVHDRGTERT